jgi:hypothetical protein
MILGVNNSPLCTILTVNVLNKYNYSGVSETNLFSKADGFFFLHYCSEFTQNHKRLEEEEEEEHEE